ncbi:uncharacterized protein LOC118442503 [Vespa mandarinia]|uniref:uncharacterized protein LOC118442503 n=1 Tax=Vespa mandarinia TaxID=7446 RepID=UPI0016137A1A|nr:uncharacterized protein LOC118442503 [Vespa mandarinia]
MRKYGRNIKKLSLKLIKEIYSEWCHIGIKQMTNRISPYYTAKEQNQGARKIWTNVTTRTGNGTVRNYVNRYHWRLQRTKINKKIPASASGPFYKIRVYDNIKNPECNGFHQTVSSSSRSREKGNKGSRILTRVSQRPRANSTTKASAFKRVASRPPQLFEEGLKRPRQEATTTESPKWTEVVKKKRNKEKPGTKATKHLHQEKKKPSKSEHRPRKRTRPDAIRLKPAQGKSYADIVGVIHQRFKTSAAGVHIRSVRQTRTGGVLLELKKTTVDIRASFTETLRKEVGETSSITELVPRATLEIRDCDCCTSSIEVEEDLKRMLPGYAGKIEIKMTNTNARQQRLAHVKIEEEAAAKLLKAGRGLVGFVSCRVKRRVNVKRCFRCLDYGHQSASCNGPDRSKLCYFCGSTGRKIKECKEAPGGIKALQRFPGGPCNSKEVEKWMRVLQGNLNRSRTAHHLLAHLCSEKKADFVLISEQYQDRAGVTRHNSTTYVSVYLTPNDRIDDLQIKLDDLEDALREIEGDLIVAGDLNAKALEWGEARPDSIGRRIMEVALRLELSVLNTGSTSTFCRPGYRETIPDVSLANEHLVVRVAGWQVIENYTGSDHQYFLFDVHRRPAVTSVKRPLQWNIARMDRERLSSVIEEGWGSQQSTSASLSPPAQARLISAATMQLIQKACAIAVPKNGTKRQRCSVYWWTNEIADLRKKCLRLRRLVQRAKRHDHDAALLAADYQAAKKALKGTVKTSERRCWKELCLDVVQNPWGLGYLIVTRRLGTNTQGTPQDARTLDHNVHTLFLSQPKREVSLDAPGIIEVPQFTEEELLTEEEPNLLCGTRKLQVQTEFQQK